MKKEKKKQVRKCPDCDRGAIKFGARKNKHQTIQVYKRQDTSMFEVT